MTEPIKEAKEPIFNEATLSYSLDVKSNPKDSIKVEIGDSKDLTQFQPQVKIMRWENEVNSSVRYVFPEESDQIVTQEEEKLVLESGTQTVKIYDKPDASEEGGVEIEIHLSEKPKSNVFTFSVNTKELDWFYQPPLTEEEIKQGARRPDNVIGSYAVYHKTKGGMNDAAGMDYKVGKAFHVYRPHVKDADGNETWGDLKLDEGLLTIVVDSDWLDKAVYPVVVDPTFGYSTIGGSNSSAFYDAWIRTRVLADGNGLASSISTYVDNYYTTGTTYYFRFGLFDVYKDKIAETSEGSQLGSDNAVWSTLSFSTSISLKSKNYYSIVANGDFLKTYYDSTTNANTYFGLSSDNALFGYSQGVSLATPEPTGGTAYTLRIYSMYLTFSSANEMSFITNHLRPRIFRPGLAR